MSSYHNDNEQKDTYSNSQSQSLIQYKSLSPKTYFNFSNTKKKVTEKEGNSIHNDTKSEMNKSIITCRSKNSVSTYLNRRHRETQEKVNKARMEKYLSEKQQAPFKPYISENSRKIVENLINITHDDEKSDHKEAYNFHSIISKSLNTLKNTFNPKEINKSKMCKGNNNENNTNANSNFYLSKLSQNTQNTQNTQFTHIPTEINSSDNYKSPVILKESFKNEYNPYDYNQNNTEYAYVDPDTRNERLDYSNSKIINERKKDPVQEDYKRIIQYRTELLKKQKENEESNRKLPLYLRAHSKETKNSVNNNRNSTNNSNINNKNLLNKRTDNQKSKVNLNSSVVLNNSGYKKNENITMNVNSSISKQKNNLNNNLNTSFGNINNNTYNQSNQSCNYDDNSIYNNNLPNNKYENYNNYENIYGNYDTSENIFKTKPIDKIVNARSKLNEYYLNNNQVQQAEKKEEIFTYSKNYLQENRNNTFDNQVKSEKNHEYSKSSSNHNNINTNNKSMIMNCSQGNLSISLDNRMNQVENLKAFKEYINKKNVVENKNSVISKSQIIHDKVQSSNDDYKAYGSLLNEKEKENNKLSSENFKLDTTSKDYLIQKLNQMKSFNK